MKTDCNVECSVLTWEWLAFFIRSLWSVDVTCDIIACQQTKRVQIVKNIYSCGFTSCRSSTFTILSCIKSVSLWYCQQITRCSIAFITNLKLKCELHSNSKSFRTCCFYKDYMCYFKSIKLRDGVIFFYCDGCQMMVWMCALCKSVPMILQGSLMLDIKPVICWKLIVFTVCMLCSSSITIYNIA